MVAMDPEVQRLIHLIKATLDVLGVSRREVARRMGMSPSYLTKLLSGKSELRLEHLMQICRAVDFEPAEFFHLAYPYPPADNSLSPRQFRELRRAIPFPPTTTPPPPTVEDDRLLEEKVLALLERIFGPQITHQTYSPRKPARTKSA